MPNIRTRLAAVLFVLAATGCGETRPTPARVEARPPAAPRDDTSRDDAPRERPIRIPMH